LVDTNQREYIFNLVLLAPTPRLEAIQNWKSTLTETLCPTYF